MNISNRFIPAFLAYIPIVGWLYVLLAHRKNEFAMFHLRQSIGLIIFLAAILAGWTALTWVLAWIPFGMLVGVMFFTLVIAAFAFGVIYWVVGMVYAIQGRVALLPIFGKLANRLPF